MGLFDFVKKNKEYKKASNAYEAGNYVNAFAHFKASAELGDETAIYNVGYMYDYGKGVKEDRAEAFKWYLKAAERGVVQAMINCGAMYARGVGTEKSDEKAFECYLKAAEQHDSEAQYMCGLMCENGIGTEENVEAAYGWYRKPASQGNAEAQYKCACICLRDSYRDAQSCSFADCIDEDDIECTVERIKDTDLEALQWYEKAAAQGNADAQYMCGLMHENGIGTVPDSSRALEWYEKATAQNHVDAMVNYAVLHIRTYGGEEDKERITRLLENALFADNGKAAYILAQLYDSGLLVKRDRRKVKSLYSRANELGFKPEAVPAYAEDISPFGESVPDMNKAYDVLKRWRESLEDCAEFDIVLAEQAEHYILGGEDNDWKLGMKMLDAVVQRGNQYDEIMMAEMNLTLEYGAGKPRAKVVIDKFADCADDLPDDWRDEYFRCVEMMG